MCKYLRRVEQGERLLVTDRNRPVAELGPPPSSARLDQLIAEGRVQPPRRRGPLPSPLRTEGDPYALSRRWTRFAARADVAVLYAESSVLVRLVRDEEESDALRAYIADADLVSCELVLTEVPRAIRRAAAARLAGIRTVAPGA